MFIKLNKDNLTQEITVKIEFGKVVFYTKHNNIATYKFGFFFVKQYKSNVVSLIKDKKVFITI